MLTLPIAIYIGIRALKIVSQLFPIPKKRVGLIIFALILWIYILPIIYIIYHLTGNLPSLFVYSHNMGWQDYLMLFPNWCGIIIILEIFPILLALDILGLFPFTLKVRRLLIYLKLAIIIFFLVFVPLRSYYDSNRIKTTTHYIKIKGLPQAFRNLSLVFLGDIHVDRYTQSKKLKKVKNTLQSKGTDMFLFSGDLISRGRKFIAQGLELMSNPKHKIASIACMGDHDYWTDPQKIQTTLQKTGWTFLKNSHQLFPYQGHQILVTGITHIYSQRISSGRLKGVLANAPEAELKILLVHQPSEFLIKMAAKYKYNLVLGGHTHGGQIVFHPLGIPLNPNQMETPFYRGRYLVHKTNVVITNGIGLTLAPLRYCAPAEITKIVISD
jgi:predicted MPP superfamily phosphohydrolase